MRQIYTKYKETKSPGDDFLKWFLIRHLNLKSQLFLIFILWLLWIIVSPNLKFWVFFFKTSIIVYVLTMLIPIIYIKLKNRVKENK